MAQIFRVDNDLFYLPPPSNIESLATPVYYFIDNVRVHGLMEITDDGFVLIHGGERIPFDPDWSICVVEEPIVSVAIH